MRNPSRRAATALVRSCDFAGFVAPSDDKHVGGRERRLPSGRSLPFDTLDRALVELGDQGSIGLDVSNDGIDAEPAGVFAARALASLRGRIGNGAASPIIWNGIIPPEAFNPATPPCPSEQGRQS